MKTVMKKACLFFLSLAFSLSLFPLAFPSEAAAATPSGTWGDLNWRLDSLQYGTLTISGKGAMPSFNQDWTTAWRSYKNNIETIRINSGVTSIGDYAFDGCISLKNVYLADTVKTIGNSAFSACSQVKQLTLPRDVTEIKNEAFKGWWNLTELSFPDKAASIGSKAFYDCHNLTSVSIPNSVESIGDSAFKLCTKLADVYYDGPEQQWNKIAIGTENEPLLDAALHTPAAVATDTWGNNITWTLYDNGLLLISGTGNMQSISDLSSDAWHPYKAQIRSVIIEEGVTDIGAKAFEGCSQLESVQIPNGVSMIVDRAFLGCSSLEKITFPDTLTLISSLAFYKCSSLTSVTLPVGVVSIGTSAFAYCTTLTGIVIPNSVNQISTNAFEGCSSLSSIHIPDSVTSLGGGVFLHCDNLSEIKVDAGNPSYCDINGVLFDKEAKLLKEYPRGKSGDYSIPDGVTEIGASAFEDCSLLTGVTIPDGVTTLGDSCFCGCTSLTQVRIPITVTGIHLGAFIHCTGLKSVGPTGSQCDVEYAWETMIPENAFYGCSNITTAVIPDTVTGIGVHAFGECNLTDVYYGGTKTQWNAVSIGAGNDSLYQAAIHYTEFTLIAAGTDTYTRYSMADLSFACSDTISTVYIGSQELTDPDACSLSPDGKTVSLHARFLDQLMPDNTYTIQVYNTAGECASAAFHIADCPLLVPGTPLAAHSREPLRFTAPQDGYYNFGYANGNTNYELQMLDQQSGSWRNAPSTQGRRFVQGETIYLRPIYDEPTEGTLTVLCWQVTPPTHDSIEVSDAYQVTNTSMNLDFTLSVTESTADNGYAIGLLVSWSDPDFGPGSNTSRYSYARAYAARNNETRTITAGIFVPEQSFYYMAILIDTQDGSILAQGSTIHHVQFNSDLSGFEQLSLNTPYTMSDLGMANFYFEAPTDGIYAVTADGVNSINIKDHSGYPAAGAVQQSEYLFGTPIKAGERIYVATAQNTAQSGSVAVYEGRLKLPAANVGTQTMEGRVPLYFVAPEDGEYSFSTNSSVYMHLMDESGSTVYHRGVYYRTPMSKGEVIWISGIDRAAGVYLSIVRETIPLRKLIFPAELTHLQDEACRGQLIDDVVFGDRIQSIGSKAFADCQNLKRVEIPAASVYIAEDAFENSPFVILYAPIGGSVEQYAAEHQIMLEAMLP